MGLEDFLPSGNERLDSQLRFTAEIDKMTAVLRRTLLVDGSRRENDAEHSWHIAVMAMLFQEYFPEPVDLGKAVQMCVVHDIVEIEAGDTFAYDAAGNLSKAEREKEAADRLFAGLPADQGRYIRGLWEEFDAAVTPEARYALCMDRMQPFFHNTLTKGHTWGNGTVKRAAVEARMAVVKENMPEVYRWMEKNMDRGVANGWLGE